MNCPKCAKITERKETAFTDLLTYYIPESEYYQCTCGWRSESRDIKKKFSFLSLFNNIFSKRR